MAVSVQRVKKGLEPYRQTFNDGFVKLYHVDNGGTSGNMPSETLTFYSGVPFSYRSVGYNRQFAALQAGRTVDLVIRVHYQSTILTGDVAEIDNINYKVITAERNAFECPPVIDLTLERLEGV